MVFAATMKGQTVHVCKVCRLAFHDEGLAVACETHCLAEPSCSLAIGRQAIGLWDPLASESETGPG